MLQEGSFEYERVDSAGFVGPGRSTPADGVVVASDRKIDLQTHVSKLFTTDLIRNHDLIVVMDSSQRRGLRRRLGAEGNFLILGDLDPLPIETRAIFDPWRHSTSGFERSYDRIDRCLVELKKALDPSRRQHSAPVAG